METFKLKISSLLLEIIVILLIINTFAYFSYYSATPLSTVVIVILNALAILYFGTRNYVAEVTCDSSHKTISLTHFQLFRFIHKSIPFEDLRYTYKMEPNAISYPWRSYRNLASWKVLKLYYNSSIIKLMQNHLGWTGTNLDDLVSWLDMHNIPRKQLQDIPRKQLQDIVQYEDTFPDSYD